jgi:uncharacterized metal-binding protein YceD (DUF177 family)
MKDTRVPEEPWSHPLVLADLPPEGAAFTLAPDEATRAALARHVGVLAVPALTAELRATPDGRGGVSIDGGLAATVRQTCVVSLEPFDNAVNEQIALRFLPEGAAVANRDEDDDGDPVDMIRGGVIDLGALVTEFLALGVDPYPRRPGAVFAPPADAAEERASPFAALEQLKRKGGQGD